MTVTHRDLERVYPPAVPRYATARNPDRPTYGPQVRRIMEHFYGLRPMPFQAEILDVALEADPATGALWYTHVLESTPRQNGKTTPLRALATWRMLWRPAQLVLGTSQDLRGALRLWRGVVDVLERAPYRDRLGVTTRRAIGDEQLRLANRSEYLPVAPTEKAGHSLTVHLGLIDEAWRLSDHRLSQGFEPATIAAQDSQLWIVSTAGTLDSVYLRHWVDLGRTAGHPRLAFFEWGAPDGADPDDPATWASCNPALGHTITMEALADLHASMDGAEFERAHLNRWTFAVDHAFPPQWWADAEDDDLALDPTPGTLVLAADVAVDRSSTAIAAAQVLEDGTVGAELIDYRPGTDWAPARIGELQTRYRPFGGIVLDTKGPGGTLAEALDRIRVPYRTITAGEMANACGALYDALGAHRFRHRGQDPLTVAVHGAVRRPLLDRWGLARAKAAVDISPLVAVALAHHGAVTRPARPPVWVR